MYPSESNTGARGNLKPATESPDITDPGSVIENLEFTSRVTIRADNVVLRNVRIVTNDSWVLMNYGKNTRIENSTVTGGPGSQASIADMGDGNFVGSFLNISGAADGAKMGAHSTVSDSFIHDLADFEGAHNDGVEINSGSHAQVVHNTILNKNSQTSCIMMSGFEAASATGVLIKDNLLAGGGYVIYGGAPAVGVSAVDNVISTRYFPTGGFWGPVTYWQSARNTWAGNTWADGPLKGRIVDL